MRAFTDSYLQPDPAAYIQRVIDEGKARRQLREGAGASMDLQREWESIAGQWPRRDPLDDAGSSLPLPGLPDDVRSIFEQNGIAVSEEPGRLTARFSHGGGLTLQVVQRGDEILSVTYWTESGCLISQDRSATISADMLEQWKRAAVLGFAVVVAGYAHRPFPLK